ncbi:hypothetical protein SAMN02745181_2805 [Rubritalea squalenifaciens DSM 18772]|uniref:Uncharacterized protein n=1 Tax=Rubritalea squalenifaciens DSM 18772 TaxID=1123071 RepID=A0A1M6NBS6_9BACT|nr:hypothetical protein [Rubritalea squalenifaciens]SHJ93132.1 hypothetical protein SAMN02745181_2805 [Rubritalea squalenifaciens DSM 18772]
MRLLSVSILALLGISVMALMAVPMDYSNYRKKLFEKEVYPQPDFSSMSWEELLEYFGEGKVARVKKGVFAPGVPTVFPDKMEDLSSKEAAMQYALANQSAYHKEHYRLKWAQSENQKLPKEGWLVYKESTPNCYYYRETYWAFSLDKNLLVYCSNTSNGVVFANSLIDEVGYDIRVIQLKPEECKRVAELMCYLTLLRSERVVDDKDGRRGRGVSIVTSDGRCGLQYISPSVVDDLYSDRRTWSGVSTRWDDEYAIQVCGDLTGEYLSKRLPELLGERWKRYERMTQRNDLTRHRNKLAPKHNRDQLREISSGMNEIYLLREKCFVPAFMLAWVVKATGELGRIEFKQDLAAIKKEVQEWQALEKALEGEKDPMAHDGGPLEELNEEEKLKSKFVRLEELRLKYKRGVSDGFSDLLEDVMLKVSTSEYPEELVKMAEQDGVLKEWALKKLWRDYPEEYAEVLLSHVRVVAGRAKKEKAIEHLLAVAPHLGEELVNGMSPEDREFYCLSLLETYRKFFPEEMSQMLKWVIAKAQGSNVSWRHRSRALGVLRPEWFPDQQGVVYPVLKKIGFGFVVGVCDPKSKMKALGSMVYWSKSASEWREISKKIVSEGGRYYFANSEVLNALSVLASCVGDEAKKEIKLYAENALLYGDGAGDRVIFFLWANDYRESREFLRRLATRDPQQVSSKWGAESQNERRVLWKERFHMARKVTAFWAVENEEVEAKMLAAFVISEPYDFLHLDDPELGYEVWAWKRFIKLMSRYPEVKSIFIKEAKARPNYEGGYLKLIVEKLEKGKP